ncbi:MAG: YkgJ family cysteine cluster protein [Thermodesulfobacteriota bacterium]
MKYVNTDSLNGIPGRCLEEKSVFSFRCHSDLSCYNRCCRNLNLFLYPYDILVLKNSLGISSDQFLDRYVDVVLREGNFFPEVLLKMRENETRDCIFLSESGCTVYTYRPHTCRLFPVEQGFVSDSDTQKTRFIHFFRPPDFCLGSREERTFTPLEWVQNQGAEEHTKMILLWAQTKQLFQNNPWGNEGPMGPKGKMGFMAAYNLDRFREFVFGSSFLKRYRVRPPVIQSILSDETELMKFGLSWIRLYLWGIQTIDISIR